MKLSRTPIAKLLVVIVPALLMALFLQPAVTLADDTHLVTYTVNTKNGHFKDADPTVTEYVGDGEHPANIPEPVPDKLDYMPKYWKASVDMTFYTGSGKPTTVDANTPFKADWLKYAVINQDVTFTMDFEYTKYYYLTYTTDGNGYFADDVSDPTTELVHWSYYANPPTPVATNADKYKFGYWTADASMGYLWKDELTGNVQSAGWHIDSDWFKFQVGNLGAQNVTLTANFLQKYADVTYKSAGNGSVASNYEKVVFSYNVDIDGVVIDGDSWTEPVGKPTAPATDPATGYKFAYWTANVPVFIYDGTTCTAIDANTGQITAEQMASGELYVSQDTEFTAHFEKDPDYVDPDDPDAPDTPDTPGTPDNPDSSGTVKPAAGTVTTASPKTGDTLPGATAAALVAGCALVAATVYLKKHSHEA